MYLNEILTFEFQIDFVAMYTLVTTKILFDGVQLFLDAIEHATSENHDAYLSKHCSCLCAYKIQMSCKMCMFEM